ncbi:CK1/CK1 protein kinase [Saprolegnia parasitica CBS 223.65]|uniref:Casein kinase I n=1 Tax=Saprolegnia parasitica (strain CBS 223.65) TaxID=695850 RepID=A0A067D3S9_SAPPC|nr:CK1/CK1 protein kinase [Saprolegnia parasitica CBS 223.65]KDO33657.1 CK1/CK1 protein kinase [Saprolegnia parasitica CBS 223.65]|eukprot:XP_012195688.1 CK1/CK1 protein kinase [Saprolegnia parasitica CBS 223.65]
MAVPLKEGLQLKQWVLGEKLGSGACSDVYEVAPLKGGQRYAMKVSPIPAPAAGKKKRKKTHADRSADALYAEHLLYVNSLAGHAGIPTLPASGAYGEDKGYRFLVLERLGRTLEDVKVAHGRLPETTVARLGLEIMAILQHIHSKRLLFVDVKPENFMLNTAPETKVYCVDFGIAERYLLVTGVHKPYKVAGVVGTPTFLSLNCHEGSTPSRRDDIEALLYVCLYLVRGDLPWQGAASDQDGARLKRATALTDLCTGLSSEWAKLVATIRACGYEDAPDYAAIEAGLARICGSASRTGTYVWGATTTTTTVSSSAAKGRPSPAKKQKGQTRATAVNIDDGDDDEPLEDKPAPATAKAKAKPDKAEPAKAATAKAKPAKAKAKAKVAPAASTRRLEAATRAVGAAAAASAASGIATRTRSSGPSA